MSVLTLRCPDDSISCGGRFKYIASEIPMNYDSLVSAVSEAIEKEAKEHNNLYVTDEKIDTEVKVAEYDYNALMEEFQEVVGSLMSQNQAKYAPKITQIVDKYLGKGKKVADTTPDQAELIYLVITEIKDELLNSAT